MATQRCWNHFGEVKNLPLLPPPSSSCEPVFFTADAMKTLRNNIESVWERVMMGLFSVSAFTASAAQNINSQFRKGGGRIEDRTRQNRTRQDRTRQDRTRQYRTRQDTFLGDVRRPSECALFPWLGGCSSCWSLWFKTPVILFFFSSCLHRFVHCFPKANQTRPCSISLLL